MRSENPQRRLAERTVDFGLSAIDLCESMPKGPAGRHICDQLIRSATSVAANYAEATEAESQADFIHKLKIAMKELKESRVWLLFAARLVPEAGVESLKEEAWNLTRMLGASINTARSRALKQE